MTGKKYKRIQNKGKKCKYPGCNFEARAKGYCLNHYKTTREKYKKVRKKNETLY